MRHRLHLVAFISLSVTTLVTGASAWADDPTTADCLTASETSLKLRAAHKLRDARAQLLVCAAQTCPTDIRKECARRVVEMNAAMPTVVFEAKDAAGNDLTDVKVAVDGQPLVDRLEGASISLDPGPHKFTFTSGTLQPIDRTLVIQEGEKDRHVAIVLGQAAGPPASQASPSPAPAAPAPASPSTATSPPADSASGGWSTQKTVGLVVGGVGVAGLVFGTVSGLVAMSDWNSAQKQCGSQCSSTSAQSAFASDRSSSETWGTISTVSFVAGGVALAAGAVLFFTAPRDSSEQATTALHVAPTLAPGHEGVVLQGAF